ncbi:MAG: hypothetical protein LUC37_02550 [Prevotella sp.]|nr:hypothetical protein [Prevotella sp.]
MKGLPSCIYWKQEVPTSEDIVKLTTKYDVTVDGTIGYTTNATPSSSTIDNFTWYPVYYSGYLNDLNGEEVTQARKISVTDRTEYNKEADMFVTVYNNQSDEYIIDPSKETTLYTDEDVSSMVLGGGLYKTGDTEYRVCSKINTRQILPTLARNLVDNGTDITDTNGWEIKIQNKNYEKIDGTGSFTTLASISVKSTINTNSLNTLVSADVLSDNYELDGQLLDESVSSYFLELLSPARENCTDFSLEGTTESDYILNFGFVSQDIVLEKDKVYALRMITGDMAITGLTFQWRSDITAENPVVIVGREGNQMSGDGYTYYTAGGTGYSSEALDEILKEYEQTFLNYRSLFQIFSAATEELAIGKANLILSGFGSMASKEIGWFYTMLDRFPKSTDEMKDEKIALIDEGLSYILFGTNGQTVPAFWKEENTTQDSGVVVSQESVQLQGLISIYDNHNADSLWNQFTQVANTSDVKYLKYYFIRHLTQN